MAFFVGHFILEIFLSFKWIENENNVSLQCFNHCSELCNDLLFLAKRSILFQHFIRVMTQLFFHCDYRCVQIGDLALKLGFLAF